MIRRRGRRWPAISRLLALDCEIVGSIADGSALLEAVERLAPDVIVLDVNLANVRSLDACREMTRLNPEMKVIMFTAMEDSNISRRSSTPEHQPSFQKSRLSSCY